MRISYVNGEYALHGDAGVSIDDRGYQFGDGVYEVIAFYNRTLIDGDLHLQRLERSLAAVDIPMPMTIRALSVVIYETIRRNRHEDGMVYLQVSRGVAKRDHVYQAGLEPQLVVTVSKMWPWKAKEYDKGTACISAEDIRWRHCDVKATALLPNMLLKNHAASQGKREAWLVDAQGYVTEGSASNVYIVNAKDEIVTRGEGSCLLPGVTRYRVLELARAAGLKVKEKKFTLEDVEKAREAFLTSTTSHIVPVVKMDGARIGDGKPGRVTKQLLALYNNYVCEVTGRCLWP